jgi:hypothetical protein
MAASEIAAGCEQHRGHEDDRQKLHASHVKPTNNDVSHALLLTMNGSGLKKDPIISSHVKPSLDPTPKQKQSPIKSLYVTRRIKRNHQTILWPEQNQKTQACDRLEN